MVESDLVERYDLVIHLVTAADGAIEFYTTENNATRTETPEQALENDRRVKEAWKSIHPNHVIVDNSAKDFKAKIARATEYVLNLVNKS